MSQPPLRAIVFGPKRHVEFRVGSDGVTIVDSTETQLGATYADPAALSGRAPSGRRIWSEVVVECEVLHALAELGDPTVLRPTAPWDDGSAPKFPTLRRLAVRTPEMASLLPACLGAGPGTRYVEGVVDILRRAVSPTPVALDPGGPLDDPFSLGWVVKATGARCRATTDPTDTGAILLESLDARAIRWSRPPVTGPIDVVIVDETLIQRVGRVSGVIDADADGLTDLAHRRPVADHGDPVGFAIREAGRLGPAAFSQCYSVPLRTAERIAGGGKPSPATVERVIGSLGSADSRTCALEGCEEPVMRPNIWYCRPAHGDRAYRRRRAAVSEAPDPVADLPSCRVCHAVLLGAADRGGICRTCEGHTA